MADGKHRVLVLNHFAAPRGQAGGTRHVELLERLDDWEYLVIASDLNPQTGQRVSSERGFSVVPVPAYSANGLRRVLNWAVYAWRALLLGARQRNVRVVYGSSPHLLAPLAGWVLATLRGVPFVMEVRDLWPRVLVDMGELSSASAIYRLLTALEEFLYRRAAAIVVMARGSSDELIRRGIPAEKIYYIPNGADLSDFAPSATRRELRDKYAFDGFTAVYAGAHGPANGLDLLIDAAKDVAALGINVVLVGGGIEKQRLVSRVESESIANVRFMDPIPKTEMPDLLAAADLGLHVLADVPLFQSAVSPNKLFDYMAAGLPVLTNCPGLVADLVAEAGCGLAVAPTDLALGLSRAAESEQSGAPGATWISQNQSRTKSAAELGALLSAVADPGRG